VPAGQHSSDDLWRAVAEALDGHGWRWRAVAVERLSAVGTRVAAAIDGADLPAAFATDLTTAARVELPGDVAAPRSVVIGALARPVTQATLIVDGAARTFVVPPHYAGYREMPQRFTPRRPASPSRRWRWPRA
jgi:hypothetical protein